MKSRTSLARDIFATHASLVRDISQHTTGCWGQNGSTLDCVVMTFACQFSTNHVKNCCVYKKYPLLFTGPHEASSVQFPFKEWTVLQKCVRQSGSSSLSQTCSTKFQDFWLTKDMKPLKLGTESDSATGIVTIPVLHSANSALHILGLKKCWVDEVK